MRPRMVTGVPDRAGAGGPEGGEDAAIRDVDLHRHPAHGARAGPPAEHALISLLALNGLRVSEATGADVEHLGLERGHRTMIITRKGGKVVTIPLAPRTARAIDLAIGERTEGRCSSPQAGSGWTGTAPRPHASSIPASPRAAPSNRTWSTAWPAREPVS
jgi:integrase